MKRLFNGDCCNCHAFVRRCANVNLRVKNKAAAFEAKTTVLCEACRKKLKGTFRYDAEHR
ncbi:MAG: hypothetical protein KGL39_30960 [Patescibacteria group bacterium]|nr:hypothetical protein [Patescibacteria group bacterium]